MKRRLCTFVLAATVLGTATSGVAAARTDNGVRPNQGGCPPGAWVANDADQWLEATLAGVESEGTTVEAVAAEIGIDPSEFNAFVVDGVFGVDGIDFNGDGKVCRGSTNPGGFPDYLFFVDDNKFNGKFAG